MLNFENIERISIPGALETCEIAKMYMVSNDNTLCGQVQKEIIEHFNPDRYTAPFSFEIVDQAENIPDKSIADIVRQRNYLAIGWAKNPARVTDFYNKRRAQLAEVEPNEAHKILARMQTDYDMSIITQNVDDAHERAGGKTCSAGRCVFDCRDINVSISSRWPI